MNPGVQGDHVGFYQDQVREVKQLAFFTSVDLDLIPKTLTITAGARWFRFDNSMKGSALSSFGCFQGGLNGALVPGTTNGCYVANYPNPYPAPVFGSTYYSYNLDHDNLSDTETGTRSRANLTWHVAPDVMLYYTFSQGFRPGGFNQNGGAPHAYISLTPGSGAPPNAAQYFIPRSFTSDDLTNNEIGWKTRVLQPSPAVERRHLQRELEQRADRVLQPRCRRRPVLQHQWSELRDQGRRNATRGPDNGWLHAAGGGRLEQQRADQLAVPVRQQSRSPRLRDADHQRLQPLPRAVARKS